MEPDERDVTAEVTEEPNLQAVETEPAGATQTPAPTNMEVAAENAAVKPRRRRVIPADPKKAPVKDRAPEECYQIDPKKMTEGEKIAVIKFYQANVQGVYDQFEAYRKNTEGAFEQARILREQNEKIKMESKAKLNLMKQNVNLLYQNCLLISMEE